MSGAGGREGDCGTKGVPRKHGGAAGAGLSRPVDIATVRSVVQKVR